MGEFSTCKDVKSKADTQELSSNHGKRRKVANNDGDVTAAGVADPFDFGECPPELPLPPHLGPGPVSEKLEIPEINGKLARLQAVRVGSVQNSVPNFRNVCRIGANRSEAVDVDRQHRRVKTWRRQVVLKHKRQGRGDTSEPGQDGLAEGKSMRPPHRHNTELREQEC